VIANEARAITKLCRNSHVNIIHVFEHGYLNSASYFIDMELCELNLEEYIRGRKTGVYGLLDWAKAIKRGHAIFLIVAIMQQLLSGLIFIHNHREVHRDLDPKNGKTNFFFVNKLTL
jgi:serine/threonine protein kinase